jgi:hypothetical protein
MIDGYGRFRLCVDEVTSNLRNTKKQCHYFLPFCHITSFTGADDVHVKTSVGIYSFRKMKL